MQASTCSGNKWETPIFVCPVGGQQRFFQGGELATARAARAKHHQVILSTATSTALEEVAKAYGTAPWYQLYMPRTWSDTEKLVKRVENAGCPVNRMDGRPAGGPEHPDRDTLRAAGHAQLRRVSRQRTRNQSPQPDV